VLRVRQGIIGVGFFFVTALMSPPAFASALSISFSQDEVAIASATPGGDVVLLGCSRSSPRGMLVTRRDVQVLHDDDGDGVVRYKPRAGIEVRSIWVAIDSESGAVGTATPAQFPLNVIAIQSEQLRKDAENELAAFEAERSHLTLVLVRPKNGAWIADAREGGGGDGDGVSNGRLQVSFGDGKTIGGKDKAPKHLKHGDVIAAVDLMHFDIFIAEVGK